MEERTLAVDQEPRQSRPSDTTTAALLGLCIIIIAGSLAFLPSVGFAQEEVGGEQSSSQTTRLSNCIVFQQNYARSAARKLARALDGKQYSLQEIELESSITVPAGGESAESTTFDVFSERNKQAVAVVPNRGVSPKTYVVVHTTNGPLIASHSWPDEDSIAIGERCEPTLSSIEFPAIELAQVRVEPFRYWGLRIVWRTPELATLQDSDLRLTLEKVIREDSKPVRLSARD